MLFLFTREEVVLLVSRVPLELREIPVLKDLTERLEIEDVLAFMDDQVSPDTLDLMEALVRLETRESKEPVESLDTQ